MLHNLIFINQEGGVTKLSNVSLENFTSIYYPNKTSNDSIDLFSNKTELINLYPFEVVLTFTIIYVIIFITGLIGNIGTCIVITKNKSMQTATNYYLFSLAISDLLLLISALPFEIYRIWAEDNYIFGQGFCTTQGLAAETSANATVLTITAFTVERYVAICHPFTAHAWSKPSRVVRYIVGIWIIALGLAIPQAIQFEVVSEFINGKYISHCNIENAFFEHSFEISTFIIFIVPMTLITVLYVLIGIQLRKSENIGPSRLTRDGKKEEFGRKSANRNTAAQKRVVKMLVAVVAAFFICWAPFHAQRLLAVYLSNASEDVQAMFSDFYLYLMYISGLLYFISTTVNPCVYHIMSKKFRKAFMDTFAEMCCCKKASIGHYAAIRKIPPRMRDMPRSVSDNVTNNSNLKKSKQGNSKTSDSCRSSFLSNNSTRSASLYDRNKSIGCEHEALKDGKKYFMLPLSFSKIFARKESDQYTISNSSLKDTDVTEFTDCDLVKNMIKINDNIK